MTDWDDLVFEDDNPLDVFEEKILELAIAKQQLSTAEQDPAVLALQKAKNRVKKLDEELRNFVISHYLETGNDHPHTEISVRQTTSVSYDEDGIIEYLKSTGNTDYFSKIDMAKLKQDSPSWLNDYTEITSKPTPFITKNLGEYIIKDEYRRSESQGEV